MIGQLVYPPSALLSASIQQIDSLLLLIILYTVPCLLRMTASSARDARFSMYFRLSSLA